MLIHGETQAERRERMHGHLMVDPFGTSVCNGDERGIVGRLDQLIGAKKRRERPSLLSLTGESKSMRPV